MREKRRYVLQSETLNSLLPTSCPSWTAHRIINYPLKYTAEVLSAGMRPREKGKLCDPGDLQTLNPWPKSWAPPRELSKKPESNITFGLCLCDLLHALSLQVLAIPLHFNTPGGGMEGESKGGREMRATEDG